MASSNAAPMICIDRGRPVLAESRGHGKGGMTRDIGDRGDYDACGSPRLARRIELDDRIEVRGHQRVVCRKTSASCAPA